MLAAGDPSLSLALSMHAGVLAFWREADPHHDNPQFADWEAQKRLVFDTALNGAWWGMITSEPGTAGNIANTRMAARRDASAPGDWRVTGEKHFGSGSSVASYMITTAVPEGEAEVSWFFLPIGGPPWDGSAGLMLRSEWVAAQREAWLLRQTYGGDLLGLEQHGRAKLDVGMAEAKGASSLSLS